MKKYVRCKVCGFIGEEKEMQDVCPACGVPKTAFESYHYTISEKRLKVLNFHLHPILVHFPQSIALLSLVFLIVAFTTKGTMSANLMIVEKLCSVLLPISVVFAMGAGYLDAKQRFTKKFGPRVKQKIIIGAVFFAASVLSTILIYTKAFNTGGKAAIIVLSLICFACSGLLGKLGGSLLEAKLPG